MVNTVFFTLFFSVAYYLLHRWRDKIRCSTGGATRSETPLHLVSLPEITAIVSLMASFIYLLGFFGIDFVQSFISHASHDAWDLDNHHNFLINDVQDPRRTPPQQPQPAPESLISTLSTKEDEEIVKSVLIGKIASHSLESQLGDCKRAASIRREALQRTTGFGRDGSGSGGAGDSGLVLVDMS